jgi:hypothetical protein
MVAKSTKALPGSLLYGDGAIAAYLHISIEETQRRIADGTIPLLVKTERGFCIAERSRLTELRAPRQPRCPAPPRQRPDRRRRRPRRTA